jgi:glycosyltransferase involved in cell wall biosynthesis
LDTPKGHVFLLPAIPLVWQSLPATHFVLVGDGPLRAFLEAQARQLGLLDTGRVHFPGFLFHAPDLMREADLLVHPSIRESLGNVLIEAGLAGMPVVATNVDGCAEVVVDGETGLLVDGTQPVQVVWAPGASPLPGVVVDGATRTLRPPLGPGADALARAVLTLLQDADMRRAMGLRARERAQRVFGLSRYARDLERAYRGGL